VVVPVQRRLGWDETKAFCKGVADALVAEEPDRYIATLSKSKRRGKIFIDYLRNGRAATTVCAYSTRARPGAPVSTPIGWEELSPRLSPDQFNIQNLPRRLASLKQDPWSEYFQVRQSITKKMRRAVGLTD
jgi:bifunctional non-homologous end joining protein LigD